MSRRRGGLFGYWPSVFLLALGLFLLLTSSFVGVAHAALGTISLTLTTYDHDGLPGAGTVDFGDVYPDTPSTVSPAVVASVASDLEWRMTAVTEAIPEGCLLEQRPQSGASWITLSPTTAVIADAEPPASPDIQGYELRLTPSWDLIPGTYTLQVTYSVAFTDQTPPAGWMTINGGLTYTTSPVVTLDLSATDDSGVVDAVSFTNDDPAVTPSPSWSAWQDYSTTATWTLPAPDGQKTVWAKYRDRAGSESVPASGSIIMDTTFPTISGIAVSNLTTTTADVSWQTGEPASRQVDYGTTTSYGQSSPLVGDPLTSHLVTLGGLTPGTNYHFRVRSSDPAGNTTVSPDGTFWTRCAPPGNLVAARRGVSSNIDLTWTAAAGATGYRVYWREQAVIGGPWGVWQTIDVVGGTTTTYRHAQPDKTHWYEYYVTALNPSGESVPSNTVTVNP